MGLCPILLNMLQFWMIDSIVKASDSLGFTTNAPVDESREPLFVNEQDSDDDGEDGPRRRPRVDLEGRYISPPINGAATHSLRALSSSSASSAHGKLDNKSTAATTTELDEPGKSIAVTRVSVSAT